MKEEDGGEVSYRQLGQDHRAGGRGDQEMQTVKYVSWEEDGVWLGYLQEYPDYWTQGETLDDLKEHLRDLHNDLSGGRLLGIRKVDELVVS